MKSRAITGVVQFRHITVLVQMLVEILHDFFISSHSTVIRFAPVLVIITARKLLDFETMPRGICISFFFCSGKAVEFSSAFTFML